MFSLLGCVSQMWKKEMEKKLFGFCSWASCLSWWLWNPPVAYLLSDEKERSNGDRGDHGTTLSPKGASIQVSLLGDVDVHSLGIAAGRDRISAFEPRNPG